MAKALVAAHPATHPNQAHVAPGAAAAAVPAQVDFMAASEETTQMFGAMSTVMQAGVSTPISDLPVPPLGFMGSLWMLVEAIGAVSAVQPVLKEDAPFNVIQNLRLQEPNGRFLCGEGGMNGHHFYLANKWFPTISYELDAKKNFVFLGVDANGNFRFAVRLPVRLGGRDPLGALSNQQGDSRYRIGFDVAAASTVYSTAPGTTMPTIRTTFVYEAFAAVPGVTPDGATTQVLPPFHGTTQHLSMAVPSVEPGEKAVEIKRVGNLIRGIMLICRDNTGARSDTVIPDVLRVMRDGNLKDVAPSLYFKQLMQERTGLAVSQVDTGVYIVFDGEHDLDGRVGQETRKGWMRTSSATNLTVEGSWGASIGSVQVIINDIKPAAGLVAA